MNRFLNILINFLTLSNKLVTPFLVKYGAVMQFKFFCNFVEVFGVRQCDDAAHEYEGGDMPSLDLCIDKTSNQSFAK